MAPTDSLMNKLTEIFAIIKSIEEENAEVSALLMQGLSLSLRLIQQLSDKETKSEISVDEQIEMVTKALGFPLEDLVMHAVQKNFPAGEAITLDGSMKEPDQATMDFITSDLDDYEKFLAATKAKESLNFLKDQI